ncbi:MAG: ATP-binding cassette domain-containing protein [Nitrospirae bacterium]|nr:MAG: ATP-binding cassette domain-containing protein [Nitrospirota bacterium]
MSLRLSIDRISKSYDGNAVLDGCRFEFEAGKTYALIGSNGSGKSTFLRICALLEQPDKGAVRFFCGDAEQPHEIPLKRKITLVLPKTGVFNSSVFNNAAYGLKIRGIAGNEIKEKAARILKLVKLAGKSAQNAQTLSSGETQRLGIARAMVFEPEIIFLDEPTAFVDAESKGIIEELISKFKDRQRTVIIATHDLHQAERLDSQILSMTEGRLKLL